MHQYILDRPWGIFLFFIFWLFHFSSRNKPGRVLKSIILMDFVSWQTIYYPDSMFQLYCLCCLWFFPVLVPVPVPDPVWLLLLKGLKRHPFPATFRCNISTSGFENSALLLYPSERLFSVVTNCILAFSMSRHAWMRSVIREKLFQ